MKRSTIGTAIAGAVLWLGLGGIAMAQSEPAPETVDEADIPTSLDVLFWTQRQRDYAFRRMEDFGPVHVIARGESVREFPRGAALDLAIEIDGRAWTLDEYLADQHAAGVVVLHNGELRLEQYRLGSGPDERWTSFSVAKSLTSTLIAAALNDGAIVSLDDPVARYIPELAGSGYAGVSVRQLLTMTSGVRWNEDYTDPQSDVARFNLVTPEPGVDPIVTYMRNLPSEAEPGTRWQYNTGETNLIGVLVANAIGRPLADYLSERVWAPFGMEQDAIWIVNAAGSEIGGCCISATIRDFARFGQFVLEGGVADGRQVVPEGWYAQAGTRQADYGVPGRGYGYQWWTFDDGSFAAQGIFGQGIFIDPARNLVIASNGDWPVATDAGFRERRNAFYRSVQAAIDAE